MFQHRIMALLACLSLVAACSGGGSTGGTVTTPADAGASSGSWSGADASSSSGADATSSSSGTDAGATSGSSSGGNPACNCVAKQAQCGFLPGCTQSCGACPVGKSCKSNKCETGTLGPKLKKFGEWCGPNKDCRPPRRLQADDDNQWATKQADYRKCVNGQCEDNLCIGNTCTKTCQITEDKKINHTGEAGSDGIEDVGVDSSCGDAEDGSKGDKWRCIEYRSEQEVAQNQSFAFCQPGETFKPCKKNADCPKGETCQLGRFYGKNETRCLTAKKQKDGKPGAKAGERCNADPLKEEMNACETDFCLGVGCGAFCEKDTDCNTAAKGACASSKCPNGDACKVDGDCSALICKGIKLYSDSDDKFNLCWPKNCELNTDCADDSYYCRYYYNGVKNAEGDPDPEDKTKVKKPGWDPVCLKKIKDGAKAGEKCDPYSGDDDDKYKKCESDGQCSGGYCGNMCKTTKDCAKGMKCRTVHYGIDLSDPDDNIDDIFLKYQNCVALPGAEGNCLSSKECKDGKQCKYWTHAIDAPKGATPTDYKYTGSGVCTTDDPEEGKPGELCGPNSTNKKLCKSGFCLGSSTNWCSAICGKKSDCPDIVTIGQFGQYKMACRALTMSANNTGSPLDTIYVPLCLPYQEATNPLTDCSKTKKCAASQTCWGFPIATGPDKKAHIDFLCISNQNAPKSQGDTPTQPSKDTGAECALEADYEECKSRLCLPSNKAGKGYCSAICNSDTDCASGMFCDMDQTGFLGIPRKLDENKGKIPLCRKKLSCTSCTQDYHCPTTFGCTNIGDAGSLAKQRCAPVCKADADCKGTDGGASCVKAVDVNGNKMAHSVCKPSCT